MQAASSNIPDTNFKFSKNQLVILSTGEYSDYGYSGRFVCHRDFDLSIIASQVSGSHQLGNGPDGLTLHLITNDFISKVDCREIHLGSYGDINLCDRSDTEDPIAKLEINIIDDAEYREAAIQLGL
ncbi:hypothetical protein V2J84_22440 [Pseudomonas alliivorans]|nr:hypothetical protein [Pseudomonas alliivorans]MEE5135180.1 hypothetical protein [Pseudomonas alliivorans]